MALLDNDRVYQATLYLKVATQVCSTTIHFAKTSAPNPLEDADDLAAKLYTDLPTTLIPCLSIDTIFQSIYVRSILPDQALPAEKAFSEVAGSVASDPLPAAVPAIFQIRQADISSKHNNRFFLSGIPESLTLDGLITVGAVAGVFADFVGSLLAGFPTAGPATWYPCTVRRQGAFPTITYECHSIYEVNIQRHLGNQRRRHSRLRELWPNP